MEEDYEEEIEINISIVPKEKNIYISEPKSSGCKYEFKGIDDIANALKTYLENYVEERINENEDDEGLEE